MDKLLQILQKDPLLPPEKIGAMLNLTPDDVKRQIKKLEDDKIILGYRAILREVEGQTDHVTAVIEVRVSPEREGGFDRIAERIAKFDEVISCFLMSGGYDILIFVEGKSLQQVASFVASRLSTIDRVQSTATHFMLKTYKRQGILMSQPVREERMTVTP
jgi:DNA-binding Lrp family transcriptional regulator